MADARTWRRAAFALFAVAAGTNVPTPLLLVYRDTLDLGPDVLTAVFGCYALGLVPALALAGPLSDRLGRRRVFVAEARIVDSTGEECARGTGTFMRSGIALAGLPGYRAAR